MGLSVRHIYLVTWTVLASTADLSALQFQRFVLDEGVTQIYTGPYQWSAWSAWTPCNGTCQVNNGIGSERRSRYCFDGNNVVTLKHCRVPYSGDDDYTPEVIQRAYTLDGVLPEDSPSGQKYSVYEYQDCQAFGCQATGWSEWTEFGECSRTCGNGLQFRTRQCNNHGLQNGAADCKGISQEFKACIKGSCPIDGAWGDWSDFGKCSRSCGNGVQYRQRLCNNPSPQNGGLNCSGSLQDFKSCSNGSCAIHGGWSAWSDFGDCSKTCGRGIMFRTRQCNNPIGTNCSGNAHDFESCTKDPCPVDGGWSGFKPLQCSTTCGTGVLTYFRTCTNPSPANGGKNCTGNAYYFTHCLVRECDQPVDGGWTSWNDWSSCPVSSGISLQTRVRHCTNPVPASGGENCPGDKQESKQCIVNIQSSWSSWHRCSVTCGNGTRARIRTCLYGDDCTGDPIEYDSCSMPQCPHILDGSWSAWSNWSYCSNTCGNGTQFRMRQCNDPAPQNGGLNCSGENSETISCFLKHCPIDGGWSAFHNLSCSVTCGTGTLVSVRVCNNPAPQYGGKNCVGLLHEKHECVLPQCSVDGSWGSWSDWSDCSLSCGNGSQTRTRLCNDPVPQHGGQTCSGSHTNVRNCSDNKCPKDGGWSDFHNISCSVTCGRGQQVAVRFCNNPAPQYGGKDCEGLSHQITECVMPPCILDGQWSGWSKFSQCGSVCGEGYTFRYRTCSNPAPVNGGKQCTGESEQRLECNSGPCVGK